MKDLEKELRKVADEVIKLVVDKNTKYGDAYFKLRDEWGSASFCVRLGDKYLRLVNIAKTGRIVTDETVEDTIRDIVGYCLLELIYLKYEYLVDKSDYKY